MELSRKFWMYKVKVFYAVLISVMAFLAGVAFGKGTVFSFSDTQKASAQSKPENWVRTIGWLYPERIVIPAASQPPSSSPKVVNQESDLSFYASDSKGNLVPKEEKIKPGSYGLKLALDYKTLFGEGSDFDLGSVMVKPTASGSILVGAADKLVMLDATGKVRWEYTTSQLLFGFEWIESTGLIYGTAGDNTMFILNAASGTQLYVDSRNGSAAYGSVIPFSRDQCLISNDNSGYRGRGLYFIEVLDGIEAWQGSKLLWNAAIPPGAEIQVSGNRIFAVTKTTKEIYIKEITPARKER